MERVLSGASWRGEAQRYQPPPSSQHRMARTPALSRASGHSSHHLPPEMPLRKANEKDLLRGLNERFAGFIEKVHHLESENRALEREIEAIRLKASSCTSLARQYEPELQELRRQVREMAVQKHQIELEQQRVEDEFHVLREKCEGEARSKAETEQSICALKKYIDSAYLTKQEMDRKAEALTHEIEFLKREHEAEVADIVAQVKEPRAGAGGSGFGKGELTAALRDIRAELEARAFCPGVYSEQHFSNQLAKLTRAAETDREALIATKAEISQYRRQLQGKSVELDSVRGMREALERQLYDLEQRHAAEIHHYQDTIRELEQELKNTKYDMSSHVQEYHDLLNVKMALDAEIYSYRKLLEGEESRYCTLSDTQIPVPYIYRQSPIYTLPRVGGVTRKAEPQYKFVEEIITETTREDIEISDTGSDDAEQREEEVSHEKENGGVAAGTEVHLEEKKNQELDAEDNTGSTDADELDNKEMTMKNEEQSAKKSTDVSLKLKEGGVNTELAEKNLTATKQSGKKDMDNNESKDDNSDKNIKQLALDTNPEKTQADKSDEDVQNVALGSEIGKEDKAKETDKTDIKQPKPTGQTTTQETVTEPGKSVREEISLKSEEEKVKKEEPQPTAGPADSSTGKTTEKDREISEVKSLEVNASTADPQPVFQKAEAEKETLPNSKADSKQTVATLQAEVLTTTKAQDNATEVQKEPAEKVKPEATLKSEVKPKPIEEEKMDRKVEAPTEIVKVEKRDSFQSTETQKTQEDFSKPSERKDVMDSEKTKESSEKNKTEKEADEIHIKEQPKVLEMETKSEQPSQEANGTKHDKTDSLKTEEKSQTKSSEIQKDNVQKDTESKSTEREAKLEQKTEKQDPKEQEQEISKETKEIDLTKHNEQPIDSKTSMDEQPKQSVLKTSPENEKSKDQIGTGRLAQKSDRTDSEAKQESTKVELTRSKDHQTGPEVLKDSKTLEPVEEGQVPSEKKLDNSVKADLKKEREVPTVTENGVK